MNPASRRRSLTEDEFAIMVSSTETSSDSEASPLDILLANLQIENAKPAPELPPKEPPPPLLKQESHIDAGEVLKLTHEIRTASPFPERKVNPLSGFVELIANRRRFKQVKDPTSVFAIKGRNILHFIAEQQDFAPYITVVEKLSKRSWFSKLIEQKDEATGETPLHTICTFQNDFMLETLCKLEKIEDILRMSGIQYTLKTRRNAFLCFGHSLLDTRISQVSSVAFFRSLVKLYGEKTSIEQIRNSLEDDPERKFTALVSSSKQDELIEALCELMQKER